MRILVFVSVLAILISIAVLIIVIMKSSKDAAANKSAKETKDSA